MLAVSFTKLIFISPLFIAFLLNSSGIKQSTTSVPKRSFSSAILTGTTTFFKDLYVTPSTNLNLVSLSTLCTVALSSGVKVYKNDVNHSVPHTVEEHAVSRMA